MQRRCSLALIALALLAIAWVKTPASLNGGQAAVPLSRPGHEDLTFWVNHNGLSEIDVEGEVGFGDMARILMRRRANRELFRAIRDRFTFRVREMAALKTPDLFRAQLDGDRLVWTGHPPEVVVAAGRLFNLPLIVENRNDAGIAVEARHGDSIVRGSVPKNSAAGYFLKLRESQPGKSEKQVLLKVGGARITATFRLDVRPLARLRVHLPVASRVYLTAADGLGYAPPGSISRFTALSAEQFFHAQDSFEIELPAGRTVIEATRGQEYRLAGATADLKPGETTEIRMRLERWVDMASEGWYSSDSHIHANYTAPHHQVITPRDVRLQTLAEDLNNANMMVANSGGAFIHDEALFEGRPHALSLPNYIVYWNEEMRNSGIYGHMSFFNLKSLVHPLYTGFRDTPQWEDYPPNYTQAEAARKQGGAVTYVHPGYAASFDGASARELPVDLALGQVDAIDVLSNNPEEVAAELWYRLLNCGFRLAASAGTDAFTNVADHYTPGGGRVYVKLDGPMNYGEWVRRYQRGRSFAGNGPVLEFTVNGSEPGDEIRLPEDGPKPVRVKGRVRSLVPLDTLEVVVNGKVVASREAKGRSSVSIDEQVPIRDSSWIALRARGPWHRLVLNDQYAFAHTSPVYVSVGGRRIASAEDARYYAAWIERLIQRVEERGRFATPERKQEVVALFRRALSVYSRMGAN